MKLFSSVARKNPPKNKFDLSHEKKMSLKIGSLIPVFLQEILPGDSFKLNTEIFMRLSPMIAPVMHRMNVYTHYFFVPNRIIWNEWEDFITGGKDGTTQPVWPHYNSGSVTLSKLAEKSLADYMGLPTISSAAVTQNFSALPFRAYTEIWNEYYRDQNLTNEVAYSKTSGLQTSLDFDLTSEIRNRAWEKDYFTSALPWTQRGPEVTIPFSAEVTYKNRSMVYKEDGTPATDSTDVGTTTGFAAGTLAVNKTTLSNGEPGRIENIESIDNGTSTINDLRRSVRLQEWLEKNARGGARYVEQLLSHWGRAPQDARLQRPEYLSGSKQPITISEVLNQAGSETVDLEPVGQMAGHGISVGSMAGFKKTFDEHGYVIGIMSVLPATAYFQGIPRHFQRTDKLEYAWPEFAQLGEQEIKNRELFFEGSVASGTPDSTFGYTPRYSEYKYGISTVHGEFKTNLDFWHMGRKFGALPALNESFVHIDPDDPELKRIFAVTDPNTDDLYCQIYHNCSALRSLPYYGTPTL